MTNKEALKAWKKLYSEIDKENWLFVGTINPQMVELAIKALEAKIWIPTSEMSPEKYDSYQVMWRPRAGEYTDRLFYEICEYDPDEDEWERIEQAGEAGAEIVAWMPLPKPYEPKEADNERVN